MNRTYKVISHSNLGDIAIELNKLSKCHKNLKIEAIDRISDNQRIDILYSYEVYQTSNYKNRYIYD